MKSYYSAVRAIRTLLPLAASVASILVSPAHAADQTPVHADGTTDKAASPRLERSQYRGWNTHRLSNGLIELHIVPEIGGRVVQLKAGGHEFFWVNPELAGKLSPESGLAPDGGWLNYGGDKLWPAPQGWGGPHEWPGPPDAVLDGQPYTLEAVPSAPGEAAVKLTSREDPRSGIQFSRVIRIFENSTRVQIQAAMKNIDTRPRRWGIWAHTQLDAAAGDQPNRQMRAWCPVNPHSQFPNGFDVIFGAKDNPSFTTDWRRGLVKVDYHYQVGKIGVDSAAGWVATVDGRNGAVFAHKFTFDPKRPYPDNASVEFWHNGVGEIHAYNRDMEFPDDPIRNPYVFESEVLSPFCELQPGESCAWEYEWHIANIGGDHPVIDCKPSGPVAEPLELKPVNPPDRIDENTVRVTGRFGVFAPGRAHLRFVAEEGPALEQKEIPGKLSPFEPLVVDHAVSVPEKAVAVELIFTPSGTEETTLLGRATIEPALADGQWSVDRAWAWYDRQPWLIGCNFLPSTAVNNIEMWQADTFDAATIDRELGWAQQLGFNTVRVFLNYVVWKDDPEGLKKRFADFLEIADRRGIGVMPILFDDCNFAGRVAKAGPQPGPVPGVHNSQWVSSPPLAMVNERKAWPDLEAYTKDMVGAFGQDRRVWIWDLYNEPGNSNMGKKSLPLMEAAFAWAREAKPRQPLTTGAWRDMNSRMSRRMMELSDVVSFHDYNKATSLKNIIAICREYGRPILCTEWLHRRRGSTVEDILPVFQAQRIGCYNWGLVFGRTQTYMPWGSKPNDPVPDLWQHDLFHADGKPFRQEELDVIRNLIKTSQP